MTSRKQPSATTPTDNRSAFTNRLYSPRSNRPTLLEKTRSGLGIRYKLIRPFMCHHNGKVERCHRKDHAEFYPSHKFFSFGDFAAQPAVRQRYYNHFPMRPLNGSPLCRPYPASLLCNMPLANLHFKEQPIMDPQISTEFPLTAHVDHPSGHTKRQIPLF